MQRVLSQPPRARRERPGRRDQMGEPERLGPESAHRRAREEGGDVARRRPHAARPDRAPGRRDPEEPVPEEQSLPSGRVPGEPAAERAPDPGPIGISPGHGDHGPADRAMEPVEVDDVEAADDDPVEQDDAQVLPMAGRPDQFDDPIGRIAPVDRDGADPDRLDRCREGENDRRDRGAPIGPGKPSVVDRDQADVRLRERPP